MNRRLAENGLTAARGEVIWLLHGCGQLTQHDLSQALGCTPRNVTGLVDALEAAGFVVRSRHPTDRRAVLVSLTPRGEALTTAWGVDREEGTARLFTGISRADLDTFNRVLGCVLAEIRTTVDEV
jgi:DNA-binding MarR family transcriptional regulator